MNKLRFLQHIYWVVAFLFTFAFACRPGTNSEGDRGEAGELDAAVTYTLTAWQQDDPTIISETFVFDLADPPPPEE